MEAVDVLVIGRSCLDYIAVVESFPEENKKVPLVFRMIEAGGQGGTSSCCIAKLDGRVTYVGKLGNDDEGRFCLKRFKDFDVNTEHIDVVKKGRTAVAYILVTRSNGNRTIVYEPSSLPKIEMDPTLEKIMLATKVILLDPEVTSLGSQLASISNNTVKIVYDGERWRDGIVEIMETADYFIPSSDFLGSKELGFGDLSITDKIALLSEMVRGELIVTEGASGAYYLNNGKIYNVAAPRIEVKDTIGAGDNFHAAFALAVSKGKDLHEAVKFSVAVASLSCREYGGRNGIPDIQEAIQVAEKLSVQRIDRE